MMTNHEKERKLQGKGHLRCLWIRRVLGGRSSVDDVDIPLYLIHKDAFCYLKITDLT